MRLALAQINTTVGDLDGNRDRIVARIEEAREAGAGLVVFPELAVTGYPPEDLLLRPAFVRAAANVTREVANSATGIVVLVGAPHEEAGRLYNACIACADGEITAVYRKRLLPNYGVFDEKRYFEAGGDVCLLEHGDTTLGLTVCEDLWFPGPPATETAAAGAELLVNLSASPFHVGKNVEREEMFAARARDNGCALVFCNALGGQDELVFDGNSFVLDADGNVLARAPGFEEALLVVDLGQAGHVATPLDELDQMRLALGLGLRDYVEKNGFGDVVIGVSGGIDSALTAAIAAEALGRDRVHCVSMPSRFSSAATQADARRLADALGVDFREIAIEPAVEALEAALAESFGGRPRDAAEENLQARIRGTLLMALSNKLGWLVLATGNKSELSVGYSTLYGDMAGGFALLKDVFKTDVWRLARHLNDRSGRELIPRSIIDRAPSAELAPGQLDEDSLPPYPELDPVLEAYVELDRSGEELVADGFDPQIVARMTAMVDRAEYKRRQAPPGVKLRPKAFGRDRRMPITNRWRG
ncbi:MAG TPA: NAD+ synthase [Gaiellaceae bacterium]|nr:NAD+ synthase [Gaiellaceae bacterium]